MDEHVLVPTDGSPLSREALEYALRVHPDAELSILHVVDYDEESYSAELLVGEDELRERARDRAESILSSAAEAASDHGGSVTTEFVYGKPSRAIVEYAGDNDVDTIVMGGNGRSAPERVLLGSVAATVVQRASVPVTIVR